MFPHRSPITLFRASAVGYVVSSLTGLAKGWQNLWDEFSGGVDFDLFWLVLRRPYEAWCSARTGLTVTRAATEKIWFTGNDFGCIRCYLGGQNGNRWNRSCLKTAAQD
jgi:hypothetical protein